VASTASILVMLLTHALPIRLSCIERLRIRRVLTMDNRRRDAASRRCFFSIARSPYLYRRLKYNYKMSKDHLKANGLDETSTHPLTPSYTHPLGLLSRIHPSPSKEHFPYPEHLPDAIGELLNVALVPRVAKHPRIPRSASC
jgi:hypothetical protein